MLIENPLSREQAFIGPHDLGQKVFILVIQSQKLLTVVQTLLCVSRLKFMDSCVVIRVERIFSQDAVYRGFRASDCCCNLTKPLPQRQADVDALLRGFVAQPRSLACENPRLGTLVSSGVVDWGIPCDIFALLLMHYTHLHHK